MVRKPKSTKRKNPNRIEFEEKLYDLKFINDDVIVKYGNTKFKFIITGGLINKGDFRWRVGTDKDNEIIFNLFSIKSIKNNEIVLE